MARFDNYQSREQDHRIGKLALLGGGIAAAVVFRRPLARGILSALESGAGRLGRVEADLPILGIARSLENTLEREIPYAARLGLGHAPAVERVAQTLGRNVAEEIGADTAFRHFLANRNVTPASLREHFRIAPILRRAETAYLEQEGNLGRDAFLSQVESAFLGARNAMPTLQGLAEHQGVINLQNQVRALAKDELQRLIDADSSMSRRALRGLGLQHLTVGEAQSRGIFTEQISEATQLLTKHGIEAGTIQNLPLGGILSSGEQVHDMRGVLHHLGRVEHVVGEHFQIPIVPGVMSISPVQLFPWAKGAVPGMFGHISASARDPLLRSYLGVAEREVGSDVFKVGGRVVAQNWGTGEMLVPEVRGGFRAASHGYYRKLAENRNATADALAGERTPGVKGWLGLGEQYDESAYQRLSSIWGKLSPDSDWIPRTLTRVVEGGASSQDVRQAANFLGKDRLSDTVRQRLFEVGGAAFNRPELASLISRAHTEEGAFAVLNYLAQHEEVADELSGSLRQMVNQWRNNPQAVLGHYEPYINRSVVPWNLLGFPENRHPADIVRSALLEEINERTGSSGFISQIRGFGGISAREREEALGYAYGQEMRRQLRNDPTGGLAGTILRDSAEAREIAGSIASREAKLWNVHMPRSEHTALQSHAVFRRSGITFLGELNENLKNSDSWIEAVQQTVTGPWAKQYGAFFTGNPRDITATTDFLEYFPRRLNDILSGLGLGLSPRDMGSGAKIFGNIFLKRVIPAYGMVEAYRYADYKADEAGLPGPSDIVANVQDRRRRFRAKHFGDHIPLLGRRELFPGLEKYIPERNLEEEIEHEESGYEPVRKGRHWLFGNRSEWQGEKVAYWAPSASQVARSHWQGAENADLNTKDYWKYSPIPLPENYFLGPVTSLLNPYHWENKHSSGDHPDRPYPVSGPLMGPTTLQGALFNATLGRLIKPRRVLYPEYVPEKYGGSLSKEGLRALNEATREGLMDRPLARMGGSYTQGEYKNLVMNPAGVIGHGSGGGGGGGFGGGGGSGGGDPRSIGVVAASGQISLLRVTGGMDDREWQKMGHYAGKGRSGRGTRLALWEMEKINRRLASGQGLETAKRLATQTTPFDDEDFDIINMPGDIVQGYGAVGEFAGIYGWMARAMTPSYRPERRGLQIPTSARAYGWERRYWDLELGDLGGGYSEITRRFLPRYGFREEFNPVPNNMPAFLPGAAYFQNFQTGDPYRIKRGEIRLPGEAFERVHKNVKMMQTRASSLGKSTEEMMQEMLGIQSPLSTYGEEATEAGNIIHRKLQSKWKRMGILLGAEERLYNKELGISGHYDAILATPQGPAITDIKTVSNKRYQMAMQQPFEEHRTQLSYYMRELGIHRGFITYVNRDTGEVNLTPANYDAGLVNRALRRVEDARRRLNNLVDSGVISRGDLYDNITKLEILGDVALYSNNYFNLRNYLVGQHKAGQLTEEENERLQAVKHRVAVQKRLYEQYPYRFSHIHLERGGGTVERIIDPNTVLLHGDDHPLRLAGMRSSIERIEAAFGPTPEGMTPAEWQFSQFGIRPGSHVSFQTEADPQKKYASDVLQTRHAVLYGRGGNVNQQLIKMGVGTESEGDYSSTGVTARFSSGEITKGRIWESIAHADTLLNSKWMRVRSPLEILERQIVYGKATGSWEHPVRDFVSPTVASMWHKNPIAAAVGLGVFAQFFGRTSQAKLWLGGAGAAIGALGSLATGIGSWASGHPWKPLRTERREDLEEYWDTIKYIKFRRLAAHEEDLAKREEHTDIQRIARNAIGIGRWREKRVEALEEAKRKFLLQGRDKHREDLAKIQDQIEALQSQAQALKLGPHGERALAYRQAYESTLYGVKPGRSPFLNVMRAFPKYKRELITGWINSSEEEREKIFSLLPESEQRVLGGYLGIDRSKIPERPELREYFRDHTLPGLDWQGWLPNVSLDSLHRRAIKSENLDPMESGIYEAQIDEDERNTADIKIPTMHGGSRHIEKTINDLLSARGMKRVKVSVDMQPHGGNHNDVSLYVDLHQSREKELRDALNLYA